MKFIVLTEHIPSLLGTAKGSIFLKVNWGDGTVGFMEKGHRFVAYKYEEYNTLEEAEQASERILFKDNK